LIETPQRKVECVETTDNCFVEQFDLWDARLNFLMVPNLPPTGTTFCMRKRVTFRAQTNFFIGKMYFVIRGSNGYFANKTEWAAPYFFKGEDGPDVHGSLFPPGNYTVTATAEDNPLHTKTISFRSRACL
jgi:hypothetical protein